MASGDPDMRVFIIDSDERREYEQAMRQRSMERTRRRAGEVEARVTCRAIKDRDKIIQAAERILGKNHGQRYYRYAMSSEDAFKFSECESFEQEKQIEGKYVIATGEKSMEMLDAIALYKDLANVEAAYRQLKDVSGDATDLPSGRAASQSAYLRCYAGAVGSTTPRPATA